MESIRPANQLTRALLADEANTTCVNVFEPMRSTDGSPRSSLYMADGLHLSRAGYRLWSYLQLEQEPAWGAPCP